MSDVSLLGPMTDGVVAVRPPEPGDAATLVAGRDEAFHRFLGPGDPEPQPTGCVVVGGETVGWVDYDVDHDWLGAGEVNVGYHVFAPHRGKGYATRAVRLLLHHLAVDTGHRRAVLLIDPENTRSLALAARAGFEPRGDHDGQLRFERPLTPPTP
jgi:RimJ/RimL family protein N-acetyltransferase